MKSEHQLRVEEFIRRAKNAPLPDKPTVAERDVRELCARLILEEALETIRDGLGLDSFALLDHPKNVRWYLIDEMRPNGEDKTGSTERLIRLADGCFDLHYVTTFTLSAHGIPDSGQLIVDNNNLDKFGPGHRLENGKLIPPPDFVKAGPLIAEWISLLGA